MPSQAALGSQRIGQSLPLRLLASTTSDASGHYVLRPKVATVAAATDFGGLGNFMVMTPTQAGINKTFVSARLVGGRLVAAAYDAAVGAPSASATAPTISAGRFRAPASGSDVSPDYGPSCDTTLLQVFGNRKITTGAVFITTAGHGHVTYESSTTSTFGNAISASGAKGSFKLNGYSSQSNGSGDSVKITDPTHNGWTATLDWTYWNFGEYHTKCPNGGDNVWYTSPREFAGGEGYGAAGSVPLMEYCAPLRHNVGFERKSLKNHTYVHGVDFAAILGISTSSTTGYSATSRIFYVSSSNTSVCAERGYPADKETAPGFIGLRPAGT